MATQTAAQKAAAAKAAAAKKANALASYGFVDSFLKAHPDVAKKVNAAVAQGWTPARLQAEIKTTGWWTTRTEAQRKWDVLTKDNPKEAARLVEERQNALAQAAGTMGLSLTPADLKALATQFVQNGSSDGEIQSVLGGKFQVPTDGGAILGTAGQTYDALHEQARQYGVVIDDATAQKYTQQVLSGAQTVQGLTDHFREQAKVMYPGIADYLERNPGATTADYASPYLQIAAKELSVPTDQMDLTDPKWAKVLTGNNGAPMSADQWTSTIRTDASYGWDYTANARTQASQMVSALQRTFGAAG